MPSLSLSSAVEVFPCPNCNETINTSMSQCTFCGAPVDAATAEQAAAETTLVSRAVSDASYIKIVLGVGGAFFLARFTLFFSWFGVFGFMFVECALLFLLVRWWVRYGRIKTTDTDYLPARRTVVIVSACVAVFFVLRLFGVLVIRPF